MTDQPSSPQSESPGLLQAIRDVLSQSRTRLQQTINHTMVQSYWEVGRLIVEEDQIGAERAAYGKKQLESLSRQLTSEFGKGFTARNLRNMRSFYLSFPIWHTVCAKLNWSHYRLLIRIDNPQAREWYMQEAAEQNWSARALERQIGKLYYERLLARSLTENSTIRHGKGFTKLKTTKKQPVFGSDLFIFTNLRHFPAFMPLF